MRTSLSFLVILSFSLVLVVIAAAYYLFSKINATETATSSNASGTSSDGIRTHAVTDLASKISYMASDTSIVWPADWQQIGTAGSGCQLATRHCTVQVEECFNLEKYANHKFKIPVDSVLGSPEMTGYAVKRTGSVLEIAACYGESPTPITQELRF